MANEYAVNQADLVAVANAIREKAKSNDSFMFPQGFVDTITGLKGLPNGISKMTSGSFTLATETNKYTFTHDLGVIPNFFIVLTDTGFDVTNTYKVVAIFYFKKPMTKNGSNYWTEAYSMYYSTSYGVTASQTNDSMSRNITETQITLPNVGSYMFFQNQRYNWFCGVIDEQG